MRKTNKYYRDILTNGSMEKRASVLKEIITKYGERDEIRISGTKFNWNHKVEGFWYNPKTNRCGVEIYWQGDSTDGSESEYISNILYGKTIPAEWDNIGGKWGMVCRHSPLEVTAEEIKNAFLALAEYISPKAVKARKEKAEREQMTNELLDRLWDSFFKNRQRQDDQFWNGRNAVAKWLLKSKEIGEYHKMSDSELVPIVSKVYFASI